jgi:hypothetical protein
MYWTESGGYSNCIRRLSPASAAGTVSTVAGSCARGLLWQPAEDGPAGAPRVCVQVYTPIPYYAHLPPR